MKLHRIRGQWTIYQLADDFNPSNEIHYWSLFLHFGRHRAVIMLHVSCKQFQLYVIRVMSSVIKESLQDVVQTNIFHPHFNLPIDSIQHDSLMRHVRHMFISGFGITDTTSRHSLNTFQMFLLIRAFIQYKKFCYTFKTLEFHRSGVVTITAPCNLFISIAFQETTNYFRLN